MAAVNNPYPNANPNPITKCTKPKFIRERKARNPLKCERTPRTHYQEEERWCFSVPPGEKFEERWNYDQVDRPLMENFASLRAGVEADAARVKGHNDRIKAFQETQAKLAAAQTTQMSGRGSARSTARDSARSDITTGRSSRAGICDSARYDQEHDTATGRSTSRSDNPFGSARSTSRKQKDLTSFPLSSLKGLQHDHPDILAKVRAQRAAQYVTTLKNPLEPPAYNSISSRQSFFPSGTNTLHPHPEEGRGGKKKDQKSKTHNKDAGRSSGQIILTSRNLDTSRMQESLNTLVDELAKTESQIARQELKIALAPKVKTFEKKGPKK